MLNKTRLALIFCTLLFGGCAVTGPADDGYDNSNEWVNIGRLLSDDAKTLYSSEQEQSAPALKPEQAGSVTLDEKTEFEQFKDWNKLKTTGAESEEYQEFLQWLKYQQFKSGQ